MLCENGRIGLILVSLLFNACSIVGEYIIVSPDTPRPTYASQCKSLAEAKKSCPELKTPHSQVLQQTLKILESAFVAMWDRGQLGVA